MITYRVEGETRDFNAFAMKHVLINFIYSLTETTLRSRIL